MGFGDGSMGMTAGSGMEGAGETERRDENDDLRLWLTTLGGFIGSGTELGVPGADGAGELTDPEAAASTANWARLPNSGGAGLLEDILRGGRSVFAWLAILAGLSSKLLNVYCPSFVFKE